MVASFSEFSRTESEFLNNKEIKRQGIIVGIDAAKPKPITNPIAFAKFGAEKVWTPKAE